MASDDGGDGGGSAPPAGVRLSNTERIRAAFAPRLVRGSQGSSGGGSGGRAQSPPERTAGNGRYFDVDAGELEPVDASPAAKMLEVFRYTGPGVRAQAAGTAPAGAAAAAAPPVRTFRSNKAVLESDDDDELPDLHIVKVRPASPRAHPRAQPAATPPACASHAAASPLARAQRHGAAAPARVRRLPSLHCLRACRAAGRPRRQRT